MNQHHRNTIMARRQDWADRALADPNMTPERRCYNAYFQRDLSSGQQTNCYVGLGFLAMFPPNVTPDVTLTLDTFNGHITMYAKFPSVSRETRKFYDISIGDLNELINMSDRGSTAEAINAYMLNRPISEV